ncbi:MAG: hypothetical protein AABX33_08570 [Nanoarchaeota archaeon]
MYEPGNYSIEQLHIANATFPKVTAGVYRREPEHLDKRTVRVGVYGNAFDTYSPKNVGLDLEKIACKARVIGELIAKEGLIFVNGACPGIPNIAAEGARTKNGMVTGFSPLMNERSHLMTYNLGIEKIPHTLIAYLGKPKGIVVQDDIRRLFMTRDLVNIFSSDAVIVIGGCYGTNHEVAVAAELGLPIMLLKGTGGVADHAKIYYESIRKPNSSAVFIQEENPGILIERMLEELFNRGTSSRDFNPRKDPLDQVLKGIEKQQVA